MTKGLPIAVEDTPNPKIPGDLLGHMWTEMPVKSAVSHSGHCLPVDGNVAGTWLDFILGDVLVLSQFCHSQLSLHKTGLKNSRGILQVHQTHMGVKHHFDTAS